MLELEQFNNDTTGSIGRNAVIRLSDFELRANSNRISKVFTVLGKLFLKRGLEVKAFNAYCEALMYNIRNEAAIYGRDDATVYFDLEFAKASNEQLSEDERKEAVAYLRSKGVGKGYYVVGEASILKGFCHTEAGKQAALEYARELEHDSSTRVLDAFETWKTDSDEFEIFVYEYGTQVKCLFRAWPAEDEVDAVDQPGCS